MRHSATTIILTLVLSAVTLSAQETPLWLRKSAISPDGKTIAFSYKGDIYTVSSQGGRATQVTTNEAYESDPMWTRDSKSIVFSSYREGGKAIFMTTPEGGIPKRITDLPGSQTPKAVLPDGRILFTASLLPDTEYDGFPGSAQLYSIGQEGGLPKIVTSMNISEISVSKDGTVIYEDYKGYEDPLRKHHTSSVTRDVWSYKGASLSGDFKIGSKGTFTKLSTFEGEDRNPVFTSDGDTFYFLSEKGGKTINVFRSSLSSPSVQTQITFAEKDPVRFLTVSDDGTICYSFNGELYTKKEGQDPKKLSISVNRDESERDLVKQTYSSGATSVAISPNGKEIAVVIRGDVFVTSEEFRTTKRITNTAEQERNLSFSKDGKELYYSSERNGCWGVYRTILTDKDDKYFTYAVNMKEEMVSEAGRTSFYPKVSPDGKWVAYLRDRTEIVIRPTKGGAVKSLMKDATYSYQDGDQDFEWSPDSHYILSGYQADGGWNNADVAMIDIESGKITNLTRSGCSDGSFKWALGGKAMTWESDKNGYRSHGSWGAEGDIYIMFFDGKTMNEFRRSKEDDEIAKILSGETEKQAEKQEKKDSVNLEKSKKLDLLLEGRENRIVRLTRSSARLGDHYLSPDGTKLYYVTPLESGNGLCELSIKEGDIKVIRRGVSGSLIPSADGKFLYMNSGQGILKLTLASGQTKTISYAGDYEFKPKAERTYMFEHIWKQVKEKFYDPAIHGIDWDYYHDNYARFLPYINNYFDFQDMLSEMLGELNGSHTGARYYPSSGESFGKIGALYDLDYNGDGLKIKEILPGGVLNLTDPEIKAGDIIESVGGVEIKSGDNWYKLFAGTSGKKIPISIKKGGKKSTPYIVQPVSSESTLMYQRWVRQREEMVEKLSGGRIGYVHVEGMDSPSFREVYSNALGKYRTCEALIVDTRHNGGGWLHDDLATFLDGKAYIEFKPRGQYIGTEPYSKWTKPSCVLVCEDNYSDASGFPYTYRTLGIGKLIGTPVPGTMTAVWWETQINSSIVFGIPEVGSWGINEGRFLENYQLEPDILVNNDPASVLEGKDQQLEAAVKEMLRQVDSK